MVPGVSGSVGEHAHEITGLVRVHSIDLKTFDLAGGVQGSQKARFPLAYPWSFVSGPDSIADSSRSESVKSE